MKKIILIIILAFATSIGFAQKVFDPNKMTFVSKDKSTFTLKEVMNIAQLRSSPQIGETHVYNNHTVKFISCTAQPGVDYYMAIMYDSIKILLYYHIPSNEWWISFKKNGKANTYTSKTLSNGSQAGKYIKSELDKVKYWEQGSG